MYRQWRRVLFLEARAVTVQTLERGSNAPVRPRQVLWQLALIESRRVALHPATLLGLALSIWAMWALNARYAPVLNRAGPNVAVPLVLLTGGALIAASEASVRMWKTEQSEAIDVAPASPRTRTGALLVGCSAPVLIGLTAQLVTLGLMMLHDPVTALDWGEVLAGPATVALGVSAGVAAGRWVPSRFSGPLTLVALVSASVYLGLYETAEKYGPDVRWLAPIIPLEFDPVELTFRAPGAHLIYLIGLVGVFASLALLRGRNRRRWVPAASLALALALALALGLVVAGATSQAAAYEGFDYERRIQTWLPPDVDYVCRDAQHATYCAYPQYEPWIDEWAGLVEPVLNLAPEEVQARQLTVRQYPTRALDLLLTDSSLDIDYGSGLATGMWWGRRVGSDEGWGDSYPFGMALGAAAWAVGLPSEPVAGTWLSSDDEPPTFVRGTEGLSREEISYHACDTWDQGRAVVALWLAAQASPLTEQHLRRQIESPRNPLIETLEQHPGEPFTYYNLWDSITSGQPYPWFALEFHKREALYAYRLLDEPRAAVVERLHRHWDTLTDPATTTLQALDILGVETLADYESRNEVAPGRVDYPPCQ